MSTSPSIPLQHTRPPRAYRPPPAGCPPGGPPGTPDLCHTLLSRGPPCAVLRGPGSDRCTAWSRMAGSRPHVLLPPASTPSAQGVPAPHRAGQKGLLQSLQTQLPGSSWPQAGLELTVDESCHFRDCLARNFTHPSEQTGHLGIKQRGPLRGHVACPSLPRPSGRPLASASQAWGELGVTVVTHSSAHLKCLFCHRAKLQTRVWGFCL